MQAKFSGQENKTKIRKEELVYASTVSTKSSITLKDSERNNRFGAVAVSLFHGIFHGNLSPICGV